MKGSSQNQNVSRRSWPGPVVLFILKSGECGVTSKRNGGSGASRPGSNPSWATSSCVAPNKGLLSQGPRVLICERRVGLL